MRLSRRVRVLLLSLLVLLALPCGLCAGLAVWSTRPRPLQLPGAPSHPPRVRWHADLPEETASLWLYAASLQGPPIQEVWLAGPVEGFPQTWPQGSRELGGFAWESGGQRVTTLWLKLPAREEALYHLMDTLHGQGWWVPRWANLRARLEQWGRRFFESPVSPGFTPHSLGRAPRAVGHRVLCRATGEFMEVQWAWWDETTLLVTLQRVQPRSQDTLTPPCTLEQWGRWVRRLWAGPPKFKVMPVLPLPEAAREVFAYPALERPPLWLSLARFHMPQGTSRATLQRFYKQALEQQRWHLIQEQEGAGYWRSHWARSTWLGAWEATFLLAADAPDTWMGWFLLFPKGATPVLADSQPATGGLRIHGPQDPAHIQQWLEVYWRSQFLWGPPWKEIAVRPQSSDITWPLLPEWRVLGSITFVPEETLPAELNRRLVLLYTPMQEAPAALQQAWKARLTEAGWKVDRGDRVRAGGLPSPFTGIPRTQVCKPPWQGNFALQPADSGMLLLVELERLPESVTACPFPPPVPSMHAGLPPLHLPAEFAYQVMVQNPVVGQVVLVQKTEPQQIAQILARQLQEQGWQEETGRVRQEGGWVRWRSSKGDTLFIHIWPAGRNWVLLHLYSPRTRATGP